jgi:hypothetical protein
MNNDRLIRGGWPKMMLPATTQLRSIVVEQHTVYLGLLERSAAGVGSQDQLCQQLNLVLQFLIGQLDVERVTGTVGGHDEQHR